MKLLQGVGGSPPQGEGNLTATRWPPNRTLSDNHPPRDLLSKFEGHEGQIQMTRNGTPTPRKKPWQFSFCNAAIFCDDCKVEVVL